MAGTFTDSRYIPKDLMVARRRRNNTATGDWEIHEVAVPSTFQTTKSFRTNRELSDEQMMQDALDERKWNTSNRRRAQASSSLDNGHRFRTRKVEYGLSHPSVRVGDAANQQVYSGPLSFQYPQVSLDMLSEMSQNDISFYGAKAISATTPTKPAANLATLLGETLLSRIPKLAFDPDTFKSMAGAVRGSGSKYLEVEFGWKPLLREVQAIMKSVVQADLIMSQYMRDSGRHVRRRWGLEPTVVEANGPLQTITQFTLLNSSALYAGNAISKRPTQTRTLTERIWFSGAYTYYVPGGDSAAETLAGFAAKADRLLGTRITPKVLWEIAPWSWLTDWIWNVGDIIANATRFSNDSLVLEYGYLMRQQTLLVTNTIEQTAFKSGPSGPVSTYALITQKERHPATPWGFGVDPNPVSPERVAILAALAASRGKQPTVAW